MINCGRDLRIAIVARELSDRDIARRANIHPSRLSRLLRGREPLTPATGQRIIRAIYPELFADPAQQEDRLDAA